MSLYYNERNLKGITKRLENELDRDSTLYEAWKNVSYPTKKDGKPFAVMNKNFANAVYRPCAYAVQPGEYELKVSGKSKTTGYYYDNTMSVYECVCYMKDDAKLAKKENYMPKQSCLNQVYKYDLDDIKKAVNERTAYYKNQVEKDKEELEKAEKAYNTFLDAYKKALEELEKVTGNSKESKLFDMVNGTVCNNYPYC